MNKLWRKYLMWVAIAAVLLPPLIFLRDAYGITDYRGVMLTSARLPMAFARAWI